VAVDWSRRIKGLHWSRRVLRAIVLPRPVIHDPLILLTASSFHSKFWLSHKMPLWVEVPIAIVEGLAWVTEGAASSYDVLLAAESAPIPTAIRAIKQNPIPVAATLAVAVGGKKFMESSPGTPSSGSGSPLATAIKSNLSGTPAPKRAKQNLGPGTVTPSPRRPDYAVLGAPSTQPNFSSVSPDRVTTRTRQSARNPYWNNGTLEWRLLAGKRLTGGRSQRYVRRVARRRFRARSRA